jgi:hypothetical protein
MKSREVFEGADFPVRAVLGTHVLMANFWSISTTLSRAQPFDDTTKRFVAWSASPILSAARNTFAMCASKSAASANYLSSRSFVDRISNALIVGTVRKEQKKKDSCFDVCFFLQHLPWRFLWCSALFQSFLQSSRRLFLM